MDKTNIEGKLIIHQYWPTGSGFSPLTHIRGDISYKVVIDDLPKILPSILKDAEISLAGK